MKEMVELGKNVKTYILIILRCSKRKRNKEHKKERNGRYNINGTPKDDKIS